LRALIDQLYELFVNGVNFFTQFYQRHPQIHPGLSVQCILSRS
jgi:hypothetical protein